MYVKICGLTQPDDAVLAARLGADAIGLNFYPASPRSISPEAAARIIAQLPHYVEIVGVFVWQQTEPIRSVACSLNIGTVQLHGDYPPEAVAELSEYAVITALKLADQASLSRALAFVAACERAGRLPNAVLIDAHKPGMHGGTGQTVPWELAAEFVARSPVPVILAGGLKPENVAEAIAAVRPWGVDVASGVEAEPGRKDPEKLRQFITAAKAADC